MADSFVAAAHKVISKLKPGKSLAQLSSQEAMNPTSTSRPKALWQSDLSENSLVQSVKILEEAAEHGDTFMRAATACLKAALFQIYKEKRDCQMHIGFLGGSGTGKSSVINALLGERHLLPVSHEEAATAVIVEISYNNIDEPDCLYRAYVEGVSEAEIRKELNELYEDKAKWDSDVGEGEEVDTEIMRRMQDTIKKFKCVFPELECLSDWARTSVDKLLTRDCARHLMDQTRIIESGNLEEFTCLIKPFIDTSKQKDGTVGVSCWPFVKVVRLFIESSILKSGIVFVDLPGVHDTSAARNAISRKHMKNLDISCVLSPTVRAGTDKGANEILNSVQKTSMQFNGLFNADKLFFVISKVDDSLDDVDHYINNHQELKSELVQDLEYQQARKDRLKDLSLEINTLTAQYEKGMKNLKKLDDKLEKDTIMTENAKASSKRKRGADDGLTPVMTTLSQARNARIYVEKEHNKVLAKLWKAQTSKETVEKDLANVNCRIKAACIKTRNQIQIQKINEEYQSGRRELGDEDATKSLQIFCVSAQGFRHLSDGDQAKALLGGFFTKNDTGIPSFRDALIATTWETRLRNARKFNEEVSNAARSLDLWSADTIADFKMLAHERAIVETKLDELCEALDKDLEKLNVETCRSIEKLFVDELYNHFDELANRAYVEQRSLVTKEWLQQKAWNTYRAINKRQGVWVPRAGKALDWNEDMNQAFLRLLLPFWEDTLREKMPTLKKPYHDRVEKLIVDFVELALGAADDISSTIRDSFENIKDGVLAHRRLLKQGVDDTFDGIDVASKDIWTLIKLECEETWKEVFETCGNESGPGMFKRSKNAHLAHLEGDGGLAMYSNASDKMKKAFEEAFEEASVKLKDCLIDSLDEIKKEFHDILEHHTAAGTRHTSRRVISKMKLNLRNALEPHFKQLYKAWEAEPEVLTRNQPALAADEPSDGELSDDLDDLLRLGTQEPDGEIPESEDEDSF
ncbi:hypothetical protein BHYA_0219g00130 [Botrytis hyacinthi]|uniref:G domain-containing protein n=1 Tax=Botrytis hyacinthi TaxID=278943 RepID=A0A4Z1GAJ7_9HELO|nr:hypothetical protein BHYA_0219g00130 [Botrytis hyacinthi]